MPSLLHAARDRALYTVIRTVIGAATVGDPDGTLAAFAKLGRAFAGAPFNRKRLQRAVENLSEAFPDWSAEKKREYALLAYEHLLMLGAEVAYNQRLINFEGWGERARLGALGGAFATILAPRPQPCILVTGHVGNWELCGYLLALLGIPVHGIYRPLDLQPLDEWMRGVRSRRGMYLVDKFGAMRELPRIMERAEHPAFVADQNAGDRGLFVPFFGRLASSYKAIALTAQRYEAPIVVAYARRIGGERLGEGKAQPRALRFEIEVVDNFGPQEWNAQPDPIFYITARYRRGLEQCIRQVPEQVLWMHRFWKARPRHERTGKPFPPALKEKIRQLPWMTEAELEKIVARSDRDAKELAKSGGVRHTVEASAEADVS